MTPIPIPRAIPRGMLSSATPSATPTPAPIAIPVPIQGAGLLPISFVHRPVPFAIACRINSTNVQSLSELAGRKSTVPTGIEAAMHTISFLRQSLERDLSHRLKQSRLRDPASANKGLPTMLSLFRHRVRIRLSKGALKSCTRLTRFGAASQE